MGFQFSRRLPYSDLGPVRPLSPLPYALALFPTLSVPTKESSLFYRNKIHHHGFRLSVGLTSPLPPSPLLLPQRRELAGRLHRKSIGESSRQSRDGARRERPPQPIPRRRCSSPRGNLVQEAQHNHAHVVGGAPPESLSNERLGASPRVVVAPEVLPGEVHGALEVKTSHKPSLARSMNSSPSSTA